MEVNITPKIAQSLLEALKREKALQREKTRHLEVIYRHLNRINANNYKVRVQLIKNHLQQIKEIDEAEI